MCGDRTGAGLSHLRYQVCGDRTGAGLSHGTTMWRTTAIMETRTKLSLLRPQTTLYHSSFYASHAFGLGLRPTNQTTQYDGLVTSHVMYYQLLKDLLIQCLSFQYHNIFHFLLLSIAKKQEQIHQID